MGGEKLINIVCRQSGLKLDAVVITCSVRALKMHGGAYDFRPGMEYGQVREKAEKENLPALVKGFENLKTHIENMHKFGLPIVVTINRFLSDTDREIDALVQMVESETNVVRCVPIEAWSKGGDGCIQAAEAIVEACKRPNHFHLLYPDDYTIKQKIEVVCKEIYRADAVDYLPVAERKIKQFTELGWDKMPICMAKTHLSLSPDPNLKNVPHGFRVIVRDIRASVGAGFMYPLLGEIMTMPGLGSKPSFQKIDIDPAGKIMGLF
jgi:formyltetrahydrofolate synthetase